MPDKMHHTLVRLTLKGRAGYHPKIQVMGAPKYRLPGGLLNRPIHQHQECILLITISVSIAAADPQLKEVRSDRPCHAGIAIRLNCISTASALIILTVNNGRETQQGTDTQARGLYHPRTGRMPPPAAAEDRLPGKPKYSPSCSPKRAGWHFYAKFSGETAPHGSSGFAESNMRGISTASYPNYCKRPSRKSAPRYWSH